MKISHENLLISTDFNDLQAVYCLACERDFDSMISTGLGIKVNDTFPDYA